MSPEHTIIVLSRDPEARLQWLREAERGIWILLEREPWRTKARLAAPLSATLVIGCRDYAEAEVLSLVEAARSLEQPVPVVLLTDEMDRYREALTRSGLLAEVLSSVATAAELTLRLGVEPVRVSSGGRS